MAYSMVEAARISGLARSSGRLLQHNACGSAGPEWVVGGHQIRALGASVVPHTAVVGDYHHAFLGEIGAFGIWLGLN
jgi:hypothetical protein